MSLNGKRDGFDLSDLIRFGVFCGMKPKKAESIVQDMRAHVENWIEYADKAGVPESVATSIHRMMRRDLAVKI